MITVGHATCADADRGHRPAALPGSVTGPQRPHPRLLREPAHVSGIFRSITSTLLSKTGQNFRNQTGQNFRNPHEAPALSRSDP